MVPFRNRKDQEREKKKYDQPPFSHPLFLSVLARIVLFLFFPNSALQNRGAAYLWMRLIHGRYGSGIIQKR